MTCQECCNLAGLEFNLGKQKISSCMEEGCTEDRIKAGNCLELPNLNVEERAGCILGRDYRFIGVTNVVSMNDDQVTRCGRDETDGIPRLEQIQYVPLIAGTGTIPQAECLACCSDLVTLETEIEFRSGIKSEDVITSAVCKVSASSNFNEDSFMTLGLSIGWLYIYTNELLHLPRV